MKKPFWMRSPRTWRLRADLGVVEYLLLLCVAVAGVAAGWAWGSALTLTCALVVGAASTASRVATIRKEAS